MLFPLYSWYAYANSEKLWETWKLQGVCKSHIKLQAKPIYIFCSSIKIYEMNEVAHSLSHSPYVISFCYINNICERQAPKYDFYIAQGK